jgi:hypothetical protein
MLAGWYSGEIIESIQISYSTSHRLGEPLADKPIESYCENRMVPRPFHLGT